MIKYLYYNHPAIPPFGINIGVWYSLDELKQKFDMDYIVYRFSPANFGWEECEEIYPKKEKEREKSKTK